MTNELAIRILTGDVLGTSEQTHDAIKIAVKALSADAVSVVRCKDCEHWIQFVDECFANCDFVHGVTDKQFYCRDGERRTE